MKKNLLISSLLMLAIFSLGVVGGAGHDFFVKNAFAAANGSSGGAQGSQGGAQGSQGGAQGSQGSKQSKETSADLENVVGTTNVNHILGRLAKIMLGLIGTLSFLIFVISGVRLIISGGNDQKIGEAKAAMFWAVTGIAICLGSYAILSNIIRILTTPVR